MAFLVLYGLGKDSHGTVVKCTAASFFLRRIMIERRKLIMFTGMLLQSAL